MTGQSCQPSYSNQTAKNRPWAYSPTSANRHNTGKMRFTSKRLSGSDVISKHMHSISLFSTFRNIRIK